jgi:uncharacterized SAM-binding protein YcdF (DUF218 family)
MIAAGAAFAILLWFPLSFLESWGNFLTLHKNITAPDAIVLLAGEDRVRAPVAATLAKANKVPVLVSNDGMVGPWSALDGRNLWSVEWSADKLYRLGVKKGQVITLSYGGCGTIYDALSTKNYITSHGMKKLIIVTSDYHTRRAFWTFNSVFKGTGVSLGVVPASRLSGKNSDLRVLVSETCKFAFYVIRYSLKRMQPVIYFPKGELVT